MSCGPQYTSKLEGMLADMKAGQELADEFTKSNDNLPIQFTMKILTIGHWPTYPNIPLKLPQELQTVSDQFSTWYMAKNKMRKLTWGY